MKKFMTILCVCLLSLTLSGCGSSELKPQEMLEDYDSMWVTIENNYAQMGMAKRLTGKDFISVKNNYRSKINDNTTPMQFDAIVNDCLKEFNGIGRMKKLDERTYTQTVRKLSDNAFSSAHNQYLNNLVNIRKSKDYYNYPYDGNEPKEIKKNLTTSVVLENHIAYVSMKSMNSEFMEKDGAKLKKFLKKVDDFDACIIDLRGMSGGVDTYWRQYIVPMNIKKNMQYTTYELFKGDESYSYLNSEYKVKDISTLPPLASVNSSDMEGMTRFIKQKHLVPTENNKTIFKGKFYLLVDNQTSGAAEKFALFSKQSKFAQLIGQNTFGDSFAIDPLLVLLPNSGMVIQFNATNALNPDGSSNEMGGTLPDIRVNKDEDIYQRALDEIKKGIVIEPVVEPDVTGIQE
ncbi:MAG: S41 family peptidase [Erysipelotrichaceae bacterium]